MPQSRAVRTLRGSAAAVVSTFVALFAHVASGGVMPGTLGIVVPLILSTTVSVLLAGRRLSLTRLTLSVAISQFLFHSLFVLGTASSIGTGTGHSAHGMPLVAANPAAVAMEHGSTAGAGMWAGHLVAALITVALLHRSESILTRLATMTGFVVARLLRALAVVVADSPAARRPSAPAAEDGLVPLGVFASAVSRRGPPVLSAR